MKLKKKNKKQNATRKKEWAFFVLLEKIKDVFLKKVWDFEMKNMRVYRCNIATIAIKRA